MTTDTLTTDTLTTDTLTTGGLSTGDLAFYRENGYLMVENAVSDEHLDSAAPGHLRLHRAVARSVTESNDVYDLDDGHRSDAQADPYQAADKQHPYFGTVLSFADYEGSARP